MTDTDKIVAAIFAAAMCAKGKNGHEDYLKAYDKFVDLLSQRERKEKWPTSKRPIVARRREPIA